MRLIMGNVLQSRTCSAAYMGNPRATKRSAPHSHHLGPLAAQGTDMLQSRAKYRFGRTLGAGTYGIVREADGPDGRVAVKIILKKNVRGNERMVLDELEMLQRLKHPHIVKFVDWFESRVRCAPALELDGHPLRLTALPGRTSTTSSPSSPLEGNCSTGSANRASSRRKTHLRLSTRSWTRSTTCTETTSSIAVGCF